MSLQIETITSLAEDFQAIINTLSRLEHPEFIRGNSETTQERNIMSEAIDAAETELEPARAARNLSQSTTFAERLVKAATPRSNEHITRTCVLEVLQNRAQTGHQRDDAFLAEQHLIRINSRAYTEVSQAVRDIEDDVEAINTEVDEIENKRLAAVKLRAQIKELRLSIAVMVPNI